MAATVTILAPAAKAIDNNFDYGDDVTWVHGKHITRLARSSSATRRIMSNPAISADYWAYFTYGGQYTAGPG